VTSEAEQEARRKWAKARAQKAAERAEWRRKAMEGAGSKERSKRSIRAPIASDGEAAPTRAKKTVEGARKKRPKGRKPVKKPRKSTYKGFTMDSGSELKFAKMLDKHGVQWEKNTERKFPYTNSRGKTCNYIPDFYLPEYDEWVEIKGRYYQTKNLKAQLEAVGDNIELIYSDELRLPECVAVRLGKGRLPEGV
jgi:hypothetical protein